MKDVDHEQLKNKIYSKEDFMDWYYEITKKERETNSNQLGYIHKNLANLNGHGRLWKLLKTDIGALVGLIVFITSVIAPYFLIKTDIEVINLKLDNVIIDNDKLTNKLDTHMELSNRLISNLDSRVSKVEGVIGKKL